MVSVRAWFKRKVADPFWLYLKQGAEPTILARSASIGFCIGLCPLVGVSTGICLLLLLITRSLLHGPMTLLANLVALPADVALVLPFMRLGELLLGAPNLPLSPVSLRDIIFNHPGDALKGVGHAILGWLVAFPFIAWSLALILQPIFTVLQKRFLKRMEAANGGSEVGLLDEDSCSVSSSDERQLRHSTSAALRPPTSGREGLSAAEAAV